ncbi:hypothetical protein [Flavobacterium sp.]
MKTTNILISVLTMFTLGTATMNAQATQATNAITSGSYLGTSNNLDVVFKRQAIAAGLIGTSKTAFGLNSLATANSVSIGVDAGKFSTGNGYNTYIGKSSGTGQSTTFKNEGQYNTFIGYGTGSSNLTGSLNVFVGANSGLNSSDGSTNTFVGNGSGQFNTSGTGNAFLGAQAGQSNPGSGNVFIGESTCQENTVGSYNTSLGWYSGFDSSGSKNVFIGSEAGYNSTGDDKLFIENSTSMNPLIWGDFADDQLKFNGTVGIGGNSTTGFGSYPTTSAGVNVSAYKLFVKGGILAHEVRVSTTWADYVFNEDYNLKPLSEVEAFIKTNGHLPNIPSAATVEQEGIEVGQMAKMQQEKIEELTLYIIHQNKEIEKLKTQIKKIDELKKMVNEFINRK